MCIDTYFDKHLESSTHTHVIHCACIVYAPAYYHIDISAKIVKSIDIVGKNRNQIDHGMHIQNVLQICVKKKEEATKKWPEKKSLRTVT